MGYSRLQQVSEWLQWVTAGYRVVTVVYSRLQQVTEWLQLVAAGYRVVTVGYRLPTGFQHVTASYRRLLSGDSGLQQVTTG